MDNSDDGFEHKVDVQVGNKHNVVEKWQLDIKRQL
jgi:hypothetical protein